jgi:hypothetical protein
VTFASAVGRDGHEDAGRPHHQTFGFATSWYQCVVSSRFLAACALFTVATPLLLIMIILVVGGFFRSLQFTAINTVAYAEVEPAQMSRATTLVSVNQQLAISAGVAVGAFSVESTMLLHHVTELTRRVSPGLHRGRDHLGGVGLFLLADADDAGHEISAAQGGRDFQPQGRGEGRRRGRQRTPKTPGSTAVGRARSVDMRATVARMQRRCSSATQSRSAERKAGLLRR